MTGRDLIIAMRGGPPPSCDFCLETRSPDRLHPEEGQYWACDECIARWQETESGK